jgi:hypothetical protein
VQLKLTSTTGPATSRRTPEGSLLARLDYPAVTGLIALIGWLAFVLARLEIWALGKIGYFVMAGHKYSQRRTCRTSRPRATTGSSTTGSR